MAFARILAAVDTTGGRDAAFERALALARVSGAELYLLHAVPAKQPFSFRATERLERTTEMRKRAEEAGVDVRAIEQHGDPADIIELHAQARAVDLIVIGSEARRGWGGPRSAVAEKVIRRTDVPTLVVATDGADSSKRFGSVVAAVDLSAGSKEVLEAAVQLASPGAVLTVVHTVKGVEAADAVQSRARWVVPEFRTYVLKDARSAVESLASGLPAGLDTRVQVSTGSAAGAILDAARDVAADLVVVGRSRGFKLMGSTALRLLRKSERSLLVIPGAIRTGRVERPRAA